MSQTWLKDTIRLTKLVSVTTSTVKIRDRKQAFRRSEHANLATEVLGETCRLHPAKLLAYVIMPDHAHFVIWPPDGEISRFLSRFKSNTTNAVGNLAEREGNVRIQQWLLVNGRRELWQDGKHSVALWSGKFIRQKIHYIHDNPVRAGLVNSPELYPWSSIGAYFPEFGVECPLDIDLSWKY